MKEDVTKISWPENWQIIKIEMDVLPTSVEFRQACWDCKVSYMGAGTHLVAKSSPEVELETLKSKIISDLQPSIQCCMGYAKLPISSLGFSYYQLYCVTGSDISNLKKAVKFHKLKVFL